MSDVNFLKHGEWEDEPDHEEFVHAELPCIVTRTLEMGHLCGYVGVPPGHPAYAECLKDSNKTGREGIRKEDGTWAVEPYPDLPVRMTDVSYYDLDVDVHGGLTWVAMGDNYHGRREGFKWLGFDCAHYGDFQPPVNPKEWEIRQQFSLAHTNEIYRNWAYVKREVEHLAEQLAAMWQPPSYEEWRRKTVGGDLTNTEEPNDRHANVERSASTSQQRKE